MLNVVQFGGFFNQFLILDFTNQCTQKCLHHTSQEQSYAASHQSNPTNSTVNSATDKRPVQHSNVDSEFECQHLNAVLNLYTIRNNHKITLYYRAILLSVSLAVCTLEVAIEILGN